MIEIRELVIRANVGPTSESTRGESQTGESSSQRGRGGNCEENIDLMIKIIKEKNER